MSGYRVTKYDPCKRTEEGIFAGNDWTSATDIGRSFDGHVLSVAEYLAAENNYVHSVELFMSVARVNSLRVADLEMRGPPKAWVAALGDTASEPSHMPRDQSIVSGRVLQDVVRACLREDIWCRLAGPRGFYVHFGYDYYMYIGLPAGVRPPSNMPEGMFVEVFDSPYSTDD